MTEVEEVEGIYLTPEEKADIEKKLATITDYQRISSLVIWMGLLMVVLHILADIYFHLVL